jgi:serine protease Do
MKTQKLFLVIGLASTFLVLAAAAARAAAPPTNDNSDDRRTPVVRAVEKAAPAVVNISTKSVRTVTPLIGMNVPDAFRQQFGDLFKPQRQVVGSLGSGVIVNPKGYIVTNTHVVLLADEIIVTLADESQHKADLVSADLAADLAIIKIAAEKPLTAIRLGTSSDLLIGETVIAVGNPFGYQHTVTTGVVSAVDRAIQASETQKYEGLIQTDAPINPGNSGGPLLNIRGELIGINTAIRAGAQGLGFAIPVDKVRAIMIDLLAVRRPGTAWLGLHFDPKQPTAVVESVEKRSPAEKAGFAKGDEVTSLGGQKVKDALDLEAALLDYHVGDTVQMGVLRGPETLPVKVKLMEMPKPDALRLARAEFGLLVSEITPEVVTSMRLAVDRGVLITGVDKDSPAKTAGFERGDVIVQIGRYRVDNLDVMGALLAQAKKGDEVGFVVVRGRSPGQVLIPARDPETEVPTTVPAVTDTRPAPTATTPVPTSTTPAPTATVRPIVTPTARPTVTPTATTKPVVRPTAPVKTAPTTSGRTI